MVFSRSGATPRSRHTAKQDTAQVPVNKIGVARKLESKLPPPVPKDTLAKDSVRVGKQALDAPVKYTAKDSIIFTEGNWAYLYGAAEVKYKDLGLKAEFVTSNMDSSVVWAKYGVDSLGKEFGYPEFSQGTAEKYEAKMMKYNFKSRKGLINHVVTKQGEGYVVAENAKKNADNSFFMKDAKYTTCDHHDHPHFYLCLTKAKVRPGKDVVTGPAYLVVADVPLPLAIPFAFFPFSSKYSSGVIFPSYADELERGFGLRDGGYYFALNDYMDLALTGEVYTKGSWGLNAETNYRKRYKYSGRLDASYLLTKYGDKEVPGSYSVSRDFSLRWSHSQDAKANMYRRLSASVNFQTGSYDRNSLTSLITSRSTNNVKSSSVNLSQTFPNSKWSLGATMTIMQRSQDSSVSVTLPNLTVNMSRIYPFKRKEAVGNERWYEKIYASYAATFSNSITTKENKLFRSNLVKDWRNGVRHTLSAGATFSFLNYINVTPSFNYDEQWHTTKVNQAYNFDTKRLEPTDTVYGFYRTFNYGAALSFETKLYGFYKPLIGSGTVQAIRHVFTPSISLSYNPDFTSDTYGAWRTYKYRNEYGEEQTTQYSPYATNVYAPSGSKQAGAINFSLKNNLEMKVKSDADSTGWKVVSLVDEFTTRFSYNMMAEQFKWSNIQANTRLKLSKSLTLNLNAEFDPYTYKLNATKTGLVRVDKLRISRGGGLSFGRLMRTGWSFSPSINQDTFKKLFGKAKDKKGDKDNKGDQQPLNTDRMSGAPLGGEASDAGLAPLNSGSQSSDEWDADGYAKSNIQWSLTGNYSVSYAYDQSRIDWEKLEYKRKLTHTLGLSGNIQPTKNWNFSFSSDYDFDSKKFSYLSCNVSRNLHCFTLSATFVPVGYYRTYYVSLRADSSLLQDLKYEKRNRSSSLDPVWP